MSVSSLLLEQGKESFERIFLVDRAGLGEVARGKKLERVRIGSCASEEDGNGVSLGIRGGNK